MKRTVVLLSLCLGISLFPFATAEAAGTASERSYRDVTEPLPEKWTIKPEIQKIERSMHNFSALIRSLGEANRDLRDDLERYLKNPKDELLASQIEKKMAQYAGRLVRNFDTIIADQDVMISSFKNLKRKLERVDGHIEYKAEGFDRQLRGMKALSLNMEKDLIRLAVQIRESEDPEKAKRLKELFDKKYRRFRMKKRYVQDYKRILKNYQHLLKNLKILHEIFTKLQGKVVDLMENLESERKYLIDNIALQKDSTRIKLLIRQGIISGERAIKNVSEKLAKLYLQVNAFTEIHDRINQDLGSFVESQRLLLDVNKTIDQIGPSGFKDMEKGLEKVIDHFYERRDKIDELEKEKEEESEKK
jgi:hypothetical protein